MRTNLFAYTEMEAAPGHTVGYISLNIEDDGHVSLTVRSSGRTGFCRSCGSQEPHGARIDIPDNVLDQLADALQNRWTKTELARLQMRVAELEQRTLPLTQFGGGGVISVAHGGGLSFNVAAQPAPTIPFHADCIEPVRFATGGLHAGVDYVIGGTPLEFAAEHLGETRVVDVATGRDLGKAD
jgi:hypothetical protein